MNMLPMYQIIIRNLTCPIWGIPVPSYGFLTRSKMAALSQIDKRETAVEMDLIDQLSTYIYVYFDNYQNKIYL